VNSLSNPAEKASIIIAFATGAGQTDPGDTDGQIAGDTLPFRWKTSARFERGVMETGWRQTKRWHHNLPLAEHPRPLSSIETDASIWTGFNCFGAVGL
jgi:hypothetical protein